MSTRSDLAIDTHTLGQQAKASNPSQSAWVSANAGSGKTFVLSRRVERLLLDGTDPSRILCLTFTKAAAGEMTNGVFANLSKWAVASDEELADLLTNTTTQRPSPEQMVRARTLFARALETPGGLRIQTIHAFCEALLHQFPLEANVPGTFTVMDDNRQRMLLDQAKRDVVLQAHLQPESSLGRALGNILDFASDHAFEKVIQELVALREDLGIWLSTSGGPDAFAAGARHRFGFLPDDTPSQLAENVVAGSLFSTAEWGNMAASGHASESTIDNRLATRIDAFLAATGGHDRLETLGDIVLTSGKPRKFSRFATDEFKTAFPDLEDRLTGETDRIIKAAERVRLLDVIERSASLFTFASAMLDTYLDLKRARGFLDFDDLVSRASDLLRTSQASAWVLYKLDGGVDHLLIDEAQDTSPRQWQVIEALVSEFFTGHSMRDVARTVFAVGDEKQSIYSFQGAEPDGFAAQRRAFSTQAASARRGFEPVSLGLSFRSTTDVLGAVDRVFADEAAKRAVSTEGAYLRHTAARHRDPGHVEVWPMVCAEPASDPDDWQTPVDQSQNRHQAVILAERLAQRIADWLNDGERLEASGKLITPGDILVLVRARDRFTVALTRALKDRNVPVSGSDRLKLTDHIAIQDLIALGRFIVTPQDDLSLAALLKSPLCGLSEDELFVLARKRLAGKAQRSLFEAVLHSDDPRIKDVAQMLQRWIGRADRMPPYEFFARLLGSGGARKRILARLGSEVEDVLDTFLDLALAHDRDGQPGLRAFIEELDADAPTIKREMDSALDEVRIMTVHAAKGLEAPVVFLVDKGSPAFIETHAPALYEWGEPDAGDAALGGWFWIPRKAAHSDISKESYNRVRQNEEDEYMRLLYVGMTRAEDRLIVCGYCGAPKKDGSLPLSSPNWHLAVRAALTDDWTEQTGDPTVGSYWKWKDPGSPVANPQHHADEAIAQPIPVSELPGWINHNLPTETALPRPLNPSGAQALIDETLARQASTPSLLSGDDKTETGTDPRLRGTAIHRLLQVLPGLVSDDRWLQAANWLKATLSETGEGVCDTIIGQVRAILEDPQLAGWFDPSCSRAEVPLMGEIELASGRRSVSGTIDRLVVESERIVLIDFKTGLRIPRSSDEISSEYATQMAIYRDLISRIYPDHLIETVLIWTAAADGPKVMPMSAEQLDDALNVISSL